MTELSVIIPTFNRAKWLLELLDSIQEQSFPAERYEVIVVDDGSTDETVHISERKYPFSLKYIHQENQGDAAARNTGAAQSAAEFILFLDDDIILEKDFLARMMETMAQAPRSIVVGHDVLWLLESNPLSAGADIPDIGQEAVRSLSFADVCSNNMSLRREDYLEIGMMEDLDFPGSSMWCDVDFSYRAYKEGYAFLRSERAFCWHRDYVMQSLGNQVKRMEEAAYRAVALFRRYPALVQHLPMFSDKLPLDWQHDSAATIFRKILRSISATFPILWALKKLFANMKDSSAARPLKRWIIGAHIYKGFRRGLESG